MTEEEMAEEYVQSIEGDDCVIITDREERKQAFLAGLHEGQKENDRLAKHILELQKDKGELTDKIAVLEKARTDDYMAWSRQDKLLNKKIEQLEQAKKIIKELLTCCRNYPQENAEKMEQAEQFMKENT